MKKIMRNNRILAIAFITVFSAFAASTVNAQSLSPVSPVELKYLGNQQTHPLFQLQVSNGAAEEVYTVLIRDEYNNPLYRERIIGNNFTKTFLFDKEGVEDSQITFEVWCEKSKEKYSYVINHETHSVESMAISKLR